MLSLVGNRSPAPFFFGYSSFVKLHPKRSTLIQCNNNPGLKISSNMSPLSTNTCSETSSSYWLHEEEEEEEEYAKAGLRKELIPKHIAIVLDGNRRWLKEQGKPLDYVPVFQTNALFADLCLKWGVGTATTFIYSYDNLQRGKEANELIFGQLERFLEDNMDNFIRKKMRGLLIGERNKVTKSLQDMVKQVEEATSREPNPQLEWRLAVCYGGTRDILQATRSLCEKAKAGVIEPNAINEATFDRELMAGGAPTPELLIRTGGELRLSNYLVWHLALAEYYFLPIQAPDFTEAHYLGALRSFQQRDRRRGR